MRPSAASSSTSKALPTQGFLDGLETLAWLRRGQLGARGHQPRDPALAGRGAQRVPVQVPLAAGTLGRVPGLRGGRARPPPAQALAPGAAGSIADLTGKHSVFEKIERLEFAPVSLEAVGLENPPLQSRRATRRRKRPRPDQPAA